MDIRYTLLIINLFICYGYLTEISQLVTCGSVVKLMNTYSRIRLHSHEVKYGSGSGQQSVTGTEVKEDINSHWVLKGLPKQHCKRGDPIECGSVLRLEHLTTKRNLHSHLFSSPLSGNQEVSAFGENGEGDTGDYWMVVCNEKYWMRNSPISFKHMDTNKYLSTSGQVYGRPIQGQMEICGVTYLDSNSKWQTMEGIYILDSQQPSKVKRDEL